MVSEYYAWLVQSFPWLQDLLPYFEMARSVWDKIESVVLLVGLFWVGRRLKHERVKIEGLIEDLGQSVDTSGQIANAAREAAEASMSRPPISTQFSNGSTANWEIIRSDWQVVRDRIELAIRRIPHKTTRAKYGNINRHSYADVINQLREDDELKSDRAWMALLKLNEKFLALRTRTSNVSAQEVEDFKSWQRDVNGSLPKLTHPRPPEPPRTVMLEAAE